MADTSQLEDISCRTFYICFVIQRSNEFSKRISRNLTKFIKNSFIIVKILNKM